MNKVLAASSILLILLPLSSAVLKKITCGSSVIGTCENPYCSVSPINEGSFGCGHLTRVINKVKVTETIAIETAGKNVSLPSSTSEYCGYDIEGDDKGSVYNTLLISVEAANPGFLHPCPYQGQDFQIRKLKIDAVEKVLRKLYPDLTIGKYSIAYVLSDDIDENIFSLTVSGEVGAIKCNSEL